MSDVDSCLGIIRWVICSPRLFALPQRIPHVSTPLGGRLLLAWAMRRKLERGIATAQRRLGERIEGRRGERG